MDKVTLQGLVDGLVTGNPNTALQVRTIDTAYINELYSDSILNTLSAPIITAVNANVTGKISYTVRLKKVGNQVFSSGVIANISATSIAYTYLIDITDTAYIPKNTQLYQGNTDGGAYLIYDNGSIRLVGTLPPGTNLRFNDVYETNP